MQEFVCLVTYLTFKVGGKDRGSCLNDSITTINNCKIIYSSFVALSKRIKIIKDEATATDKNE